jgi:hypothetical protein
MLPCRAYFPETLNLLSKVLENAAHELNLGRKAVQERERLAACILSVIDSATDDVDQLHAKSLRLYRRSRSPKDYFERSVRRHNAEHSLIV